MEITPQNIKEWVIDNIPKIVDEILHQYKVLEENGFLRTDSGDPIQSTIDTQEEIIQKSITTEEEDTVEWSDEVDENDREHGYSKKEITRIFNEDPKGLVKSLIEDSKLVHNFGHLLLDMRNTLSKEEYSKEFSRLLDEEREKRRRLESVNEENHQ
jgi:hypothetical protein